MMEDKTDRCFLYRCRVCGKIDRNPHFMSEKFRAIEMAMEMLRNGQYKCPVHNITEDSTSLHFCEDGTIGVSDFIGIAEILNGG
jgi:hypothetical protein